MAILGISTFETELYILNADPSKGKEDETENATIFELGSLDVDVRARIMDNSLIMTQNQQGTRITPNQNGSLVEAVRYGLVGWRNFNGADGKAIEFKREPSFVNGKQYQIVDSATLSRIPMSVIKELGTRILEANSVGEK